MSRSLVINPILAAMAICVTAVQGLGQPPAGTHPRLTIVNGCASGPIWVFYQVGAGGGSLPNPIGVLSNNGGPVSSPGDPVQLASNQSVSYYIPDMGIAATRFWAAYGCDSQGNNCQLGDSGGAQGGVTLPCPAAGCAPSVDSKIEGTFGCISGTTPCQNNPSNGRPLTPIDWIDTSMVDGFTLPYKATVDGSCTAAPQNNTIDCTQLSSGICPTGDNLSYNLQNQSVNKAFASMNLNLVNPSQNTKWAGTWAGCYAPGSILTMNNWGNAPANLPNAPAPSVSHAPGVYSTSDPIAAPYTCGGITSAQCNAGPVVNTKYVEAIHKYCPQTYAFAYDDQNGLFQCNAATGTSYTMTFYCPATASPPKAAPKKPTKKPK